MEMESYKYGEDGSACLTAGIFINRFEWNFEEMLLTDDYIFQILEGFWPLLIPASKSKIKSWGALIIKQMSCLAEVCELRELF